MTKEEVLEKLEQYKGRPIEIFCDNAIHMYIGLAGHWVFSDDTGILEIRKNAVSDKGDINGMGQYESPFVITYTEWEHIQYIIAYIPPDAEKIKSILDALTPVGTDKTKEEISKEILTDSIIQAKMAIPSNFNSLYATDPYGQFPGYDVSTSINGPSKLIKHIIKETNKKSEEGN